MKHKKAYLITELEKYLVSEDYCHVAHGSSNFKFSFAMNVMANTFKMLVHMLRVGFAIPD